MPAFAKVLPRLGETERIALEAGTVWWDGDLFGGMPDWKKLLDFAPPPLRGGRARISRGPAEELCRRLDDWDIYQRRDLPPEIWDFIKRERFFGMIIPKEFGGLGFSALAHSRVVTRLSSRSVDRGGHRDGAELARTWRAPDPLRHRCAEERNICRVSRPAMRFRASR